MGPCARGESEVDEMMVSVGVNGLCAVCTLTAELHTPFRGMQSSPPAGNEMG